MKAKFSLAIITTTALLTACGGHDKVHAVDKIEEAQAQALEKAPKAEEIKFADHGQAPMGGVGGANPQQPTATQVAASNEANAIAKAQAIAHHGIADQASTTVTAEPVKTEDTKKPSDNTTTDTAQEPAQAQQ